MPNRWIDGGHLNRLAYKTVAHVGQNKQTNPNKQNKTNNKSKQTNKTNKKQTNKQTNKHKKAKTMTLINHRNFTLVIISITVRKQELNSSHLLLSIE